MVLPLLLIQAGGQSAQTAEGVATRGAVCATVVAAVWTGSRLSRDASARAAPRASQPATPPTPAAAAAGAAGESTRADARHNSRKTPPTTDPAVPSSSASSC